MAKINIKEMITMIDQKVPITDIADHFGTSKQAIYQAVKKCGLETSKSIVNETVKEVVEHKLDAIEQLNKCNKHANDMLDLLMRWTNGEDEVLHILENNVRRVNVGTRDEPQWMEQINIKDPREIALKAMGEIRQQVNLMLEIQKTLHHMTEVKEVLSGIVEIVKKHLPPEGIQDLAEEVKKRKSLMLEMKG